MSSDHTSSGFFNPFDLKPSERYTMNLSQRFETANRVRDTIYMDTKMRASKSKGTKLTDMSLHYDWDFRTKQRNTSLQVRKRRIFLLLAVLAVLQISYIIFCTNVRPLNFNLWKISKVQEFGASESGIEHYRLKRESGQLSEFEVEYSEEKVDSRRLPLLLRRLHNLKAERKQHTED